MIISNFMCIIDASSSPLSEAPRCETASQKKGSYISHTGASTSKQKKTQERHQQPSSGDRQQFKYFNIHGLEQANINQPTQHKDPPGAGNGDYMFLCHPQNEVPRLFYPISVSSSPQYQRIDSCAPLQFQTAPQCHSHPSKNNWPSKTVSHRTDWCCHQLQSAYYSTWPFAIHFPQICTFPIFV